MSGVVSDDEEGSVTFSSTRKVVDCIPSSREQAEEGSGTCNVESASPLPKSKGSVKEIVLEKMKREEDITVAGIGDVPTGSAYKVMNLFLGLPPRCTSLSLLMYMRLQWKEAYISDLKQGLRVEKGCFSESRRGLLL